MKLALQNGQLYIKEADNMQFTIIKSWNKMKWNKSSQTLQGPADIELLNKLAELVRLPLAIEEERQRLNRIQEAVDEERMSENPVPLYKYPVKLPLFKHQVRGANMCLLTFGLVQPPKTTEKGEEK